jgi:chromosome segregation ATPase
MGEVLRAIGRIFIAPRTKALLDENDRLQKHCADLEERLHALDEHTKETGGLLYELQRVYASEHFELQESMRNLNIERMRNAGAFADREIVLERARLLQTRIAELKSRLSRCETVDAELFDEEPIVVEERPAAPPAEFGKGDDEPRGNGPS